MAAPCPDETAEVLRARVEALEAELATLRDDVGRQARMAERLGASGWRLDAEGLTREVSAGLCALLERPREELVGRRFEEIVGPFCAERLLVRDGEREERGLQLRAGGGTPRWVDLVASPTGDGWLVRVLDVTAARGRRVELQRAEALLSAAIEVSPAAIIVADARTGELRVANAAARDLSGVGVTHVEEASVQSHLETWNLRLADGTPLAFHELPIVRALAGERVIGLEGQIDAKDGTSRWIRGSAAPVRGEDGAVTGAILVVSDLTERRAAERERDRLKEQVASARKAESLAVMAGAIAHDFNNALMAISGEAALAYPEVAADSSTADALARILKSTEVAATLTRQLLAYAGRARLDVREREVAGFLSEVASDLRRRHPSLELRVTCASDLPVVRIDGPQLEQSLGALAKNAVEAGASCLEVTARVARIDDAVLGRMHPPTVANAGKHVCIFVSDDGPGMDAVARERAFDPFYTTKGIGRGLGLAALAGVVGAHGGGVTIDNGPTGGIRVGLYLPVLKGPSSQRRERPIRRVNVPTPVGGRILVVDDEAAVREVVARGLTTRGFQVVRADSGAAALRILDELDGDVAALVLDVSMPEMTGPELFESVRARWQLPVLFMSGYAADDAMTELILQPGVDFAAKPFRVDELADRLRVLTEAATA